MGTSLTMLAENLKQLAKEQSSTIYHIPTLWLDNHNQNGDTVIENPAEWLLASVRAILKRPYNEKENNRKKYAAEYVEGWIHTSRIYSLYVRHFSAYDHDGDGIINPFLSLNGWRETGTFIKTIAALPYIKSLGIDTLHLLPVTKHGTMYKKGNLGSPYAVADHYALDNQLAESILWIPIEHQFGALVEAAHRMGIRVITEFAFRTMSRDTHYAIEHPDWFYWIKSGVSSSFSKPVFSDEELSLIHNKVEQNDYSHLPKPKAEYTEHFVNAISVIRNNVGILEGEAIDNTKCVLPPAFADYPPNDPQPSWDDITYLKFHTHSDFQYVAYNTIRMYDTELHNTETNNNSLWKHIEDIIGNWKKKYNIDGAFLDMSHALPIPLRNAIMKRARRNDTAFAFIDESFGIETANKEFGFDAVVGNLWLSAQRIDTLEQRINDLQQSPPSVSYLATPDTHNTPRVAMRHGEEDICRIYTTLFTQDGGIPFITSGSEFGETVPINTGLAFTIEELQKFQPDTLPLFSSVALDWKNANMKIINHLRSLANKQ